jgi:hypothetical protein
MILYHKFGSLVKCVRFTTLIYFSYSGSDQKCYALNHANNSMIYFLQIICKEGLVCILILEVKLDNSPALLL